MPTISVIVPVYNAEKYLKKCIDSILIQTFTNFELIIVNDGSVDNSFSIAKAFEETDSRVHVINKKNGGVSSARNAGIERASGQYIMFCDADDFVHEKWCETFISAALDNPTSWIVSNIFKVHDNSKTSTQTLIVNSDFTYFDIYKMGLSPYTFNKIFNLDIIKKHNLLFNESIQLGEDIIFNNEYFQYCNNVIFLKDPLYYYCINDNSATNKYYSDRFKRNAVLFKSRLPLIKDNEIDEFCTIYFYSFVQWLDNAMDKRNTMSFWNKMRYNHKMMRTEEFRYCVAHASGESDSKLFMRVVKTHNYYLYWAFQKMYKLKDKLRGKTK